jgi:Domain of unknown function (DUF4357)
MNAASKPMSNPFSLRIFVADGDPDGLRVVERSNWIGKALVFPRALLPKVKQRDELGQTGIYLLLGPRDDGEGEKLYIGEGDPIRPRLESHYAQKDFWTRAVCFVTATAVPLLTCKGKGVLATGFEASQGFVVKAGSHAVAESVPSMQQHVHGMYELRQQLMGNGVLAAEAGGYRFSQDYVFTSHSTAAAVVLGRSANGRIEWKDARGRMLKELQAQEASA